jgi:ribonuclease P protein component
VKSSYQGLKKADRLEQKAEFDRAYKQGKRLFGHFFVAYLLAREEGPLRLGVVASRKVGKAVERSRAKRLLREAFRKNRPAVSVSADVVLIARSSINEASARDVEKAYARTVSRALEQSCEDSG